MRSRVCWLLWPFVFGACAPGAGRLLVVVDTDISVPGELGEIDVEIDRVDGAGSARRTFALGAATDVPLSFVVSPRGSVVDVDINIAGYRRGAVICERLGEPVGCVAPLVSRRAVTGFVPGSTRVLRLFLADACVGATCDAGATCESGRCAPVARIDPATLPVVVAPGAELDAGVADGGPRMDAAPSDASASDAGRASPRVVQVAGGGSLFGPVAPHACARVTDGRVFCWGSRDGVGALGDGAATGGSPSAVAVVDLSGPLDDAVELSVGGAHSCVIRLGGRVSCWGAGLYGQLGDGAMEARTRATDSLVDEAVQLSLGDQHSCAVRRDGDLVCWGRNASLQLGVAGGDRSTPVDVSLAGPVRMVSSGLAHTCAIVDLGGMGRVMCWGANTDGELGIGSRGSPMAPGLVPGIDATWVSAGNSSSCAVLAGSGAVSCWGDNSDGQLGDGTSTSSDSPTRVQGILGAVQVEVGFAHSCALLAGGAVECWGNNGSGALGDGTTGSRSTPAAVLGVSDALNVSAARGFTCAARASATSCWGTNAAGELGDGMAETRSPVPVTVVGLP